MDIKNASILTSWSWHYHQVLNLITLHHNRSLSYERVTHRSLLVRGQDGLLYSLATGDQEAIPGPN